jgi:DNA mismatch repair protein MSH4
LDVARQTYKEATEDVHTLVEEISKEYDLQLELRFESGRGYYLRLPSSDLEDRSLPAVFVNVVKRKRFVEMTTLELMKRNLKVCLVVPWESQPIAGKLTSLCSTLIL